jgi:hypothetical protein
MFTSIRSVWGALGVMLALIALYLVLNNSKGATALINSGGQATGSIFKILQGR